MRTEPGSRCVLRDIWSISGTKFGSYGPLKPPSEDARMDRREQLLKHITKRQKGIEIGPWYAPLAAKREGYNCLSFDVFDTETLKRNAEENPDVHNSCVSLIEAVDIVGSSTEIYDIIAARGELLTFDYILSSHNFE